MKKIYLFLVLGAIILTGGLIIWAYNSPFVDDYIVIHKHNESELELAFAFTTALRKNDPAVYDFTDPSLKARVDDWMNGHQKKRCTQIGDTALLFGTDTEGYNVIIDCYIKNSRLVFTVDNIVIRDMKVINWGEVKEKYD